MINIKNINKTIRPYGWKLEMLQEKGKLNLHNLPNGEVNYVLDLKGDITPEGLFTAIYRLLSKMTRTRKDKIELGTFGNKRRLLRQLFYVVDVIYSDFINYDGKDNLEKDYCGDVKISYIELIDMDGNTIDTVYDGNRIKKMYYIYKLNILDDRINGYLNTYYSISVNTETENIDSGLKPLKIKNKYKLEYIN